MISLRPSRALPQWRLAAERWIELPTGTSSLMIAEVAIHDASSYAAFAPHIDENSPLPMGPLYGAGRPRD